MNSPLQQNRRRLRIVDHVLQKSLLAALVIMEAVAVAIAIWVLYTELGEIVDENMYRVHIPAGVSVLSQLTNEGMRVLGGVLLLNVLALIAADRIWAFYVHDILHSLGRLMTACGRLDFSEQARATFDHVVLDHARSWRDTQAAHLAQARDCIRQLPAQMPGSPLEREALAASLVQMQAD